MLEANAGQPTKRGKTYFPISGSARDYPATRNGVIRGVRQEVIDAFDATEPYQGGAGHALWQLNELNKIQKHNLLIAASSTAAIDLTPDLNRALNEGLPDDPRFAKFKDAVLMLGPQFFREVTPLHEGYVIFEEPIELEMQKDRKFRFEAAFHQPGIVECEPAFKLLQDLWHVVSNTVKRFEVFLP